MKANFELDEDKEFEFINESIFEFDDISSEYYREYVYDTKSLIIANPERLHVSDSGGHRVVDNSGKSYYIPPGWLWIEFMVREGEPHFSL